jgi:signal transduction histidine kinase
LLWLVGRALNQLDDDTAYITGLWLGDLWGVLFFWVLVGFPDGRVGPGFDRLVPLLMAVVFGPLELAWLLFWRPAGHPTNPLVVWPDHAAADNIDTAQRLIVVLAAVTLAAVLARRWLAASRPLRRVLVPGWAGAAALLLAAGLNILSKLGVEATAVRRLLLLAMAAVPIAVVGGIVRARLARAGIGDLVLDLHGDPPPERVREATARALGDPSLEIGYWLAKPGLYATADGTPVELPADGNGRSTTFIERNGAPIAALVHDSSLDDEPELLSAVAAAAAIALENGQLHADLQSRMDELHGMQRWASAAGALERRRLERDLHDGTQQRLIALAADLALLERRAAANPELAERLVRAREQVAASLAELRDVAHGRRPAVLDAGGLAAAIRSAVATLDVPTRLRLDVPDNLPEHVETGIYYVIAECLANIGRHARASTVEVEVTQHRNQLWVDVCDDGVGGADLARGSGLRGLARRVDDLGGRFDVRQPTGGGTHVHAELPGA